MLAASWQFGLLRTLVITIAALSLTLAKQLASTPEVNAGHRAGGKGFQGVSVNSAANFRDPHRTYWH